MGDFVVDEAELRKRLTAEEFKVTRQHGTERAFSGKYWKTKEDGVYACKVCDLPLFNSDTKFDSGTGWPSFYDAIPGSISEIVDSSWGMRRVETVCSRCKSHLGHVFDDGPKPTGLRYCMNSASLDLKKAAAKSGTAAAAAAPQTEASHEPSSRGCSIM